MAMQFLSCGLEMLVVAHSFQLSASNQCRSLPELATYLWSGTILLHSEC